MNIFLISRGYPTKNDPQWGCFERDQAEALTSLGHKVIVISVDSRFRLRWRKIGITKKTINGIDYFDLFCIPGIVVRILGGIKFEWFIKRILLEYLFNKIVDIYGKPDVLYSHYLVNSYISTFIKQKYNIPLVAIEHWSRMMSLSYHPSLYKLASYAYTNVDRLITVSKPLKERINKVFSKDSIVIPNILGSEFLNYKEKESVNDVVNFISVGSLLPIKSYESMITAFSNLQLPRNKWHLTIIGDGPLRNELLQQVKSSGLETNITFKGRKTKEEIVENLSDSDVFILTSKSETFGVVFIEALSQGLPCIATKCGGPEDIIDESNGLLVPLDDIDKLQQAITYMFFNHSKYDRKEIAQTCYNHYSPKVVAAKLTDIFEQVLKS